MIDIEKISKAKEVICNTVLNQVQDGAQSKELEDAFACGQFLKVPTAIQRGLHGTAAAIRVLAGFDSTNNEQLRKLLKYLENIKEFEKEGEISDGLERDLNNIIKNSEILYSLSFIHSGTANTEKLKEIISTKLIDSKKNDGGWAYFLDADEDSDMYFTSSVYLALRSHNYNNLQSTREFLIEKLKKYKKENIPDPTTYSKLCFIVYTFITLNEHKKSKEIKKLLVDVFKKLWKSEFCVIDSDFEQNIEYPGKQKHYYVRIPWQLYLLAIANNLVPRYFAQRKSISRFNSIIKSITNEDGFIYKQSGKNISSRTYSIIFETLCSIEQSFKLNWKFYFRNAYDWIRSLFKSRIFKNLASIIGAILIIIALFNTDYSTLSYSDIVPSIIASLLIVLVQTSKKG
ncbi:MAG: hypothetical protein AB7S69_16765 [Salinivirgaceae bacterium]